eukprot:maker-scaffold172_size289735-snap-gene-1.26 protein:Tk06515 transcript:maker-scaffold172_size289735-snap-gene-1.26-mRNA-1 annotation:"short-chain dehydrogenase reductase family 16c member 6-like"
MYIIQELHDFGVFLFRLWFAWVVTIYRAFFPQWAKTLSGQVVVITGAGHGIGRELALQCARLGAIVACWDIDPVSCAETSAMINKEWKESGKRREFVPKIRARSFQCDVSKQPEVARAARETSQAMGEVWILINNAGIMPSRPLMDFKPEEIEEVFRVNVFSQFWTIREFLPEFVQRNYGHIVSMCSVAGITGTPYLVPYCASKFALKGLMDSLFMELRKKHSNSLVQLTTVHPFTINTGLAVNPTTRFPSLIPITEPAECARRVILAITNDEEEVYIPRLLNYGFKYGKCLPRRVQLVLADYMNCGVGY